MTERIPDAERLPEPAALAHIRVSPSEPLRTLLGEFYDPSVRRRHLSNLALASAVKLPFYPGEHGSRVHLDEEGNDHTIAYEHFRQHELPKVSGRNLPLLAHVDHRQSSQGDQRVTMAFLVNSDYRRAFANLPALQSISETGVLKANLDIHYSQAAEVKMFRSALRSMMHDFGVNHPSIRNRAEKGHAVNRVELYGNIPTSGGIVIPPRLRVVQPDVQ